MPAGEAAAEKATAAGSLGSLPAAVERSSAVEVGAPAPTGEAASSRPTELLWARPVERRRPRLSREEIVDAAITIADAEGITAVSIRRVAAALNARPMSLYSHFDRKDDLLALMSDQVAAEILVPEPMPADWRDRLRAIAHRTRDSALRHPWVLRAYAGPPHLGPNALQHAEQSAAAVADLPLAPARRVALLRAIDTYTLGQVAAELHERLANDSVDPAEVRAYLTRTLDSGQYPHLAALPRAALVFFVEDAGRERFDEGLDWLLAGVTAELEAGSD
ncbi:TetR/AcrR family transcriptional regulator C-terminal domain-containing protein [Frankia sp. AgKG'84/4]|uniref:TetR/AcrR family transcriptional regulator C-terminal domain-containing protein n=1 Tax=Frankia sp. AgKG'84/4 TaxID=573490 RepID=UPI00202A8179|nr:TetR/AcrR family transcriptional regulator [Frankia sp. AgKG'84/4]MCL9793696.1 TetR/AcrR family transcriptional regulator [Frankia sp. AgKG'84/4]